MRPFLVVALVASVSATLANPRIIFRATPTATPAYLYNIQAGGFLSVNNAIMRPVRGFAADEVNQVLYSNNNTELATWRMSSLTSGVPFQTLTAEMDGLAFSPLNGKLYGSRNDNSNPLFPRGLYEVNPLNGACLLVFAYPAGFDLGGIDFDPRTGDFFAANDGPGQPVGIYRFNDTLTDLTLFGPYPVGLTDIDGLAAYGGRIWLYEDRGAPNNRMWKLEPLLGYTSYVLNYNSNGVHAGATAFSIGAPGPRLYGSVNLQDYSPGSNGVPVFFELRSGSTVVTSRTILLPASGQWSLPIEIAPGNYTLRAKGSHWLRQQIAVTVTATGATGLTFSLKNGDCNGDNEVGAADFSLLAVAYDAVAADPNYSANADLNGDGEVGASDFSILAANYDEVGD